MKGTIAALLTILLMSGCTTLSNKATSNTVRLQEQQAKVVEAYNEQPVFKFTGVGSVRYYGEKMFPQLTDPNSAAWNFASNLLDKGFKTILGLEVINLFKQHDNNFTKLGMKEQFKVVEPPVIVDGEAVYPPEATPAHIEGTFDLEEKRIDADIEKTKIEAGVEDELEE